MRHLACCTIILLFFISQFVHIIDFEKPSHSFFGKMSYDEKILYVGGTGANNYTKIQDAINAANDGDIIFVYSDSSPYYENVVINKSVKLIGEKREDTIIDGKGERVITVDSNNVEIKHFTLINGSGVRVNGNFNLICNNDILGKGKGNGVYNSDGMHGNKIYNNKISGYSDGILLRYDGYEIHVINNSISNCEYCILVNCIGYSLIGNTIVDGDFAIYIASFGREQCFVNNNSISNVSYGICVESFTPLCYVENNTVYNAGTAIRVMGNAGNATIKNNILSDGYYGIRLSSNNSVIRNEIDNFIYGIEALGRNNTILKNNFVGNRRNAVFQAIPNTWDSNYWYNWKFPLPKPIFGMTGKLSLIPWIQFDYHPAKEPWKIGGGK